MSDKHPTPKRLIEVAFPLRETSIDSVHEKNVRHGHISTLHIWPARRPLAACRAALIATLLPDPGDKETRDAMLKRLGGTLKKTTKKKQMPNGRVEEIDALETDGGILHWGRESGPDLDWFRREIRKAYGGRAPKVLDPFAGGGAIPLEAMRLGCEVTAMDINPVAWFILKCTLEYPQKLAGQTRRLPDFALKAPEFMADYLKAKGMKPPEIRYFLLHSSAMFSSPASGGGVRGEGLSPSPVGGGGVRGEGLSPSPIGGGGVRGEGPSPRPPAQLPPDLLQHARDLRKSATDAERLVWYLLRGRRLAGAKFRRQHPIGRYILDFYCDEHRLVVELDGGQHAERQVYDATRDDFLRARGLTVLRFWNNEVLGETEAVLQRIWEHVAPSPPTPLPLAGEGSNAPAPPSHSPPPQAGEGLGVRGETGDLFGYATPGAEVFDADLAWHVRAWGRWVLRQARRDLAPYYPTYAEFCSLKPYRRVPLDTDEPLRWVPTNADGEPQPEVLNAGFDHAYLDNPANPRWIAKPTVAYLWARTVRCKSCRATVPLLKTRWLAKKDNKRVLLTLRPNADRTGVEFGIDPEVKVVGTNPAQRREHDKRIGAGTMSRAGATCPCCDTIMTMKDVRLEALGGRLGALMTSVVVDTPGGKGYRLPLPAEIRAAEIGDAQIAEVFGALPFGVPDQRIPVGASREGGGSPFTAPLYGLDQWHKLFLNRQLATIATLVGITRRAIQSANDLGFTRDWFEATHATLALVVDRIADRGSSVCHWDMGYEKIANTFSGFRLPISWAGSNLKGTTHT